MAAFIKDKNAETVAEAILEYWVKSLGSMKSLNTDSGSEFLNSEMSGLCEYLGVKMTAIAAFTPNANGINERNHGVVDTMMYKMMAADPSLKPKLALAWAITAANSLDNVSGYSPAQIVFGRNPTHPSLMNAGPAGMEEVDVGKSVAIHIHAMHLAREAYIQCESDKVLAEALKRRVFVGAGEGRPGMWIYYKQSRHWKGPVKVHSVDGKKIYSVGAGRLLTINKDEQSFSNIRR